MKAIVRWLALIGFSFGTLVHAQEIVTLPTRAGAMQSYFLARAPENPQAGLTIYLDIK